MITDSVGAILWPIYFYILSDSQANSANSYHWGLKAIKKLSLRSPYLWWPGLWYWPGMAASHHVVWTLHWRWSQGQIQPTYDFLLCSCQKGYLRISDDQACSTDPEWLPPTTLCGHYTEGEVKVKYNPHMISFFVAVKRVTSVSLMTRPAVLTRNGCLPPRCADITLKVKSRSNTTHIWFPSL